MKAVLFTLTSLFMSASSIYEFKMNSIDGKLIDFSQYKGKTLLIVNTASKCGYTPQYAELEKLHEQFGSKVIILGFPACPAAACPRARASARTVRSRRARSRSTTRSNSTMSKPASSSCA